MVQIRDEFLNFLTKEAKEIKTENLSDIEILDNLNNLGKNEINAKAKINGKWCYSFYDEDINYKNVFGVSKSRYMASRPKSDKEIFLKEMMNFNLVWNSVYKKSFKKNLNKESFKELEEYINRKTETYDLSEMRNLTIEMVKLLNVFESLEREDALSAKVAYEGIAKTTQERFGSPVMYFACNSSAMDNNCWKTLIFMDIGSIKKIKTESDMKAVLDYYFSQTKNKILPNKSELGE